MFLPYVIKIDLYNFELYHFKVGAFFLRHSVRMGGQLTVREVLMSEFKSRVNGSHSKHEVLIGHMTETGRLNHLFKLLLQHRTTYEHAGDQ